MASPRSRTAWTVSTSPGAATTRAAAKGPDRRRRSFGTVERMRSGRYQASYTVDGQKHVAPTTFLTKGDAGAWLSLRQAELIEHRWRPESPPDPERITFAQYSTDWLAKRELSPKTRREYERMLEGRLASFRDSYLDEITAAGVKEWWIEQGDTHVTARRRAYELLRAILRTAARPDEDTDAPPLIATSPARLSAKTLNRRSGSSLAARDDQKPQTRLQPATLPELAAIMDAMPERYRAMVLLAAWCAPRFGELTELRRRDLKLDRDQHGKATWATLRISRAVVWPEPDQPIVKTTKTRAGIRDVAVPPHLLPLLEAHLKKFAAHGPDGLLFPAVESGDHMKHGALYKVYRRARRLAGRPDLRWHDLRHTGATLAAQTGATLAELMNRLGHSDVKAALIYQHAAADRDAEIARRLSAMAAASQATTASPPPSTTTAEPAEERQNGAS